MKDSDTISSWDELLASLETAVSHPVDTAWQIYRYLQNNYTTMGSHQVRMLLVAYLKLPVDRPSLVHSCVLGIAVKISSEYADFQFPQFLQMWGYDRYLREEDKQRQTGKDGRSYPSPCSVWSADSSRMPSIIRARCPIPLTASRIW